MTNTTTFPVIDMEETGKNIERLRKNSGMTVRELQEMLGFTTPQSIYKWQWGQSLPDIANLLFLAGIWNVSVEDILITSNRRNQEAENSHVLH